MSYQHTAAGPATFSWTEIIDGEGIPDRVMAAPAVQTLRELDFSTAAFDDDLFSHGKEQWLAARSEYGNNCSLNLVDIPIKERFLSLPEALQEAVPLNNRLRCGSYSCRIRCYPRRVSGCAGARITCRR